MQQNYLTDTFYSSHLVNQESQYLACDVAETAGKFEAQDECANCGNAYLCGELACNLCGAISSFAGNTEQLDHELVERMQRVRRVGELVQDARKPVVLLIDTQSVVVPVADAVVIGRRSHELFDQQPDIDLAPFNAYQYGISRRHLRIIRTHDLVRVADLGSLNGTYLNGFRLAPHQDRLIRNGDELYIGRLRACVSL